MDVTSIAALATSMSAQKLSDDVGTSVLKKAMDIQKTIAVQLLQALPPAPALASSGSVGTQINTTA